MYQKNKNMEVLTTLKLHQALKVALGNRTQVWLSDETGIAQSEVSRMLRGDLIIKDAELTKFNKALKTNFSLQGSN